jgi:hypothetical protein
MYFSMVGYKHESIFFFINFFAYLILLDIVRSQIEMERLFFLVNIYIYIYIYILLSKNVYNQII